MSFEHRTVDLAAGRGKPLMDEAGAGLFQCDVRPWVQQIGGQKLEGVNMAQHRDRPGGTLRDIACSRMSLTWARPL